MAEGGKLPILVPCSSIKTITVSFETVRHEAVSLKAVRLEGLRGRRAVNPDLMVSTLKHSTESFAAWFSLQEGPADIGNNNLRI